MAGWVHMQVVYKCRERERERVEMPKKTISSEHLLLWVKLVGVKGHYGGQGSLWSLYLMRAYTCTQD